MWNIIKQLGTMIMGIVIDRRDRQTKVEGRQELTNEYLEEENDALKRMLEADRDHDAAPDAARERLRRWIESRRAERDG